jgi:uncharacterized protein YndB with AHSA1/START domain
MNIAALKPDNQAIMIDEVLPHAPETVWKTLTSAELMGRWLHMTPTGFAPVKGTKFTYQTTPAGAWDGTIHCEVLEVIAEQRLSYAWRSGDESNCGYGSRLDTVVTFTLSRADNGTRLRMVHSGFVLPRNETAFSSMNGGWRKVVPAIGVIAGEQASSKSSD